jgi:hypothetical protein
MNVTDEKGGAVKRIPSTPELTEADLDEIRIAVGKMANAREDRDNAIQDAYRDNVPVPDIAEAAGLSRQRVHQIVG